MAPRRRSIRRWKCRAGISGAGGHVEDQGRALEHLRIRRLVADAVGSGRVRGAREHGAGDDRRHRQRQTDDEQNSIPPPMLSTFASTKSGGGFVNRPLDVG